MSFDNKEKIILEWKYKPPDFFEDLYIIEKENYKIEIDKGKIKATVLPEFYDFRADARNEIHEEVNDLFLGAQTLNFRQFNLSKPSIHRLHPDGRKDITIFPDPIVCKVNVSNSVDIIVSDKDGKIIEDTKAKRIKAKRHFAQLSANYRNADPIVSAILGSYNTAVNDSANEFIHLYEIKESLCDKFGNEKGVRDALGVSKNRIERLRKLANTEPVTEGRHRGKNPGQLRKATNIEKKEAREITRELIQNYLEYLDAQNQ